MNTKWFWSDNIRYKFGGAKKVAPPELPSAAPIISEMAPEAMKAGQAERKRLRKRTGRAGTIFAGRRPTEPATTAQTGLRTTLG